MENQKPTGYPNLHSRMGSVEARVDALEKRTDTHDGRIQNLEHGDTAILAKLQENDSRWATVQQQLQVVDQIQDIRNVIMTVGKGLMLTGKFIKYLAVMCSLLAGIYIAVHTGDLSSLITLIQTLIGFN